MKFAKQNCFHQQLTRSFDLEFSVAFDSAKGLNSRGVVNDELPADVIDETETRAIIGIRWVPITRASRELTVEINSLLE